MGVAYKTVRTKIILKKKGEGAFSRRGLTYFVAISAAEMALNSLRLLKRFAKVMKNSRISDFAAVNH